MASSSTKSLTAETLSDLLICPITYELLKDPVIDTCGHTFSKVDIQAWLKTNPHCPLSGRALAAKDLKINYLMQDALDALEHHSSGTALEEDEKELVEAAANQILAQRTADAAVGIRDRLSAEQRLPSLTTRVIRPIKEFYRC